MKRTRLAVGRWVGWALGLGLVAAVVLVAGHVAEARDFARMAERAEPWWLALAVAAQLGTYVAQGEVLLLVARAGRASFRLSTACRLGLTKLLVDQVVPTAGLSGTVLLARGMERRGMARATVSAALVVDLASYYAAYVVCLALALGIAARRGGESALVVLVSAVFSLFGVALSGLVLALSGRGSRPVPRLLARVRPVEAALSFVREANPRLARSPSLLLQSTAYQLAIVLLDAGTLWVLLRSLGSDGSPLGVFASFMVSSLLRTVGILPGGLGTFEAASVLTLRWVGVPIPEALAATLLFRGLSFWLPMVPGFFAWRREARATG